MRIVWAVRVVCFVGNGGLFVLWPMRVVSLMGFFWGEQLTIVCFGSY